MLVLFYLCLSFVLFGISLIIKSCKKKVEKVKDLIIIFIPQLFNILITIVALIVSLIVDGDAESYFYFFVGMIFFVPALISTVGILVLLYKQKCKIITKFVKNIKKKIKGLKRK